MLKKGLVFKTIIAFALIVVFTSSIIGIILSQWLKSNFINEQKKQLDGQISSLSKMYVKDSIENKYTLREKTKRNLELTTSCNNSTIFIVDKFGYVDAVSDSKYDSIMLTTFLRDDFNIIKNGGAIETTDDYRNFFGEDMYVYIKKLEYNGVFYGAVATFTSFDDINSRVFSADIVVWISIFLVNVLSFVVVFWFLRRKVIKPLGIINNAARKISKGEVEKRVDIKSNDEIGQLAESFNIMADSIDEVEKNRREFISNVSHELRSPITSIKGFIGGIIDGIIPPEKERYYLTVAYDEIQRLTRLVNDLLDLSAIEAGKFKLNTVPIDVNELVRISVIKFEPGINKKKLNVDVILEDDNLFVKADKDRLIQVITNLIDNAIKYVYDQGMVTITTKTRGDKVIVSVYNNGPSIPKEDLQNIWKRFYKSDKSRTTKVSTGLGLPIVRSILTQLGEDIWVENGEEEGVTFFFTLSKV